MRENAESKKAFERYEQIIKLLKENEDIRGLNLVKDLVKLCIDYVELRLNFERLMEMQKFRKQNDEEVLEEFIRLGNLRKIKHNAMMSQLKIVNRYLFKKYEKGTVPIGGLYTLDPLTLIHDNREIVGDWAAYLVDALYRRAIINKN